MKIKTREESIGTIRIIEFFHEIKENIQSSTMSSLKILCQNVRGLRTKPKMLNYIIEINRLKPDIMVMVDTHFSNGNHITFKNLLKKYKLFSNTVEHQSRGISIIVRKSLDITILDKVQDSIGNLLAIKMSTDSTDFVIAGHYAPSADCPQHFENVFNIIFKLGTESVILCGDNNTTLNHNMDNVGYNNGLNNPNSSNRLNELINESHSSDIYRKLHSKRKQFTWFNSFENVTKRGRLDFFLTSAPITNVTKSAIIHNLTPISDHCVIEIVVDFANIKMGKGYWKWSDFLCVDTHHFEKIIDTWYDTYFHYVKHRKGKSFKDSCTAQEKKDFFEYSINYIVNLPLIVSHVEFLEILIENTGKTSMEYQ